MSRAVVPRRSRKLKVGSRSLETNGPNFNRELTNLPVQAILGGGFRSAIIGITQSYAETVKFIKQVCFTTNEKGTDFGSPIMVSFTMTGLRGPTGTFNVKKKLQVPFLTLINLPFLRLERLNLFLNVKLNFVGTKNIGASVSTASLKTENRSHESSAEEKTGNSDSYKPLWNHNESATMMGVVSSQQDSKTGVTTKKEYSLAIEVRAKHDGLPVGISSLIDLLENEISDTSVDNEFINKMYDQMANAPPPTIEMNSSSGEADSQQ